MESVGQMQARSITMKNQDWLTVREIVRAKGLSSRSAGVRFIIHDWRQLRSVADTPDEQHDDRR